MSQQQPVQPLGGGTGLMYTFAVEEINQDNEKLTDAQLAIISPPGGSSIGR
jgi:hypothetical protein